MAKFKAEIKLMTKEERVALLDELESETLSDVRKAIILSKLDQNFKLQDEVNEKLKKEEEKLSKKRDELMETNKKLQIEIYGKVVVDDPSLVLETFENETDEMLQLKEQKRQNNLSDNAFLTTEHLEKFGGK